MPDPNNVAISSHMYKGSTGHVRIYSWDGSNWTQKGVNIDGESQQVQAGLSACPMPIQWLLVLPSTMKREQFWSCTRIYSWDGSNWAQKGTDIDGENTEDRSGWSVSMPDSNTVAIGATGNDANGLWSGHVRIYSWDGSNWTQKGADIDGENIDDFSGYCVSMPDANTVAIGAPSTMETQAVLVMYVFILGTGATGRRKE